MKTSIGFCLALLSLCVQPSLQMAIYRRTNTTGPTGLIQIENSSNKTLNGYWGYLNLENVPSNGVVFQFTSDKNKASNFSIANNYLSGYKTGYAAGSSNSDGTASHDAIYIAPLDFFRQGGEPVVNAGLDNNTGIVSLSNKIDDGTYRNLSQACSVPSTGHLPVLAVGKNHLGKECADVTLYWHPVNN